MVACGRIFRVKRVVSCVIIGQLLAVGTEDLLRGPRVNFALAKDDPVAALFKRNFAVLHPPLDVRGCEVQIIGDPVKIKQLERHNTRASVRT